MLVRLYVGKLVKRRRLQERRKKISMLKQEKRLTRKKRIRSKVFGTSERPRLSIFRSNRHIFAQVIDDDKGKTLFSVNDVEIELKKNPKKSGDDKETVSTGQNKKVIATLAGELLAKKGLALKIKKVVFDRNGYQYHGRVKDFADGVRKGGLEL